MDNFNILMIAISASSLIIALISIYFSLKTKKRYEKIAMKLGNGQNIADILKDYINKVNDLDKKDDQIIEYCNKINEEINKNIKKIGLIKYNLYNTTKNDLSFALALLDRENNGVILNSIYGVDYSNVYCKLIINGKSKERLSTEEIEALNIAINK